jgi:hypothetical protein
MGPSTRPHEIKEKRKEKKRKDLFCQERFHVGQKIIILARYNDNNNNFKE